VTFPGDGGGSPETTQLRRRARLRWRRAPLPRMRQVGLWGGVVLTLGSGGILLGAWALGMQASVLEERVSVLGEQTPALEQGASGLEQRISPPPSTSGTESAFPTALPSDTLQVEHFRVIRRPGPGGDTVSPQRAREVAQRLLERQPRIQAFLGVAGESHAPAPVEVHLHPTVEAKALATGQMQVAHVIPDERRIHLSLQEGLEGDRLAMEAMLTSRDRLGESPARALELGIAVHLSEVWLGADPQYWTARLRRGDFVPPLERLLDDELFASGSMLALPAAAAVLVDWLVEERGLEGFRELYRAGALSPEEVEALASGWEAHLDGLAGAGADAGVAGTPPAGPPPPPANFRQGFNFAHEGYQIYNGYGSRQARESLGRLEELGTNAVAILPYTFLRDPNTPAPLRISNRAGSENDAAVLNSALAARDLGMSVLLKPHIWLRGSWPGEIRMGSEEEWDRFFSEYARWIGHYALMAQAYGLESFCMGNELSAAALEHPDRWRELAERIREVYTGELGYCANWGEEVETLEFWDAVDFIGVSAYYPLASDAGASDRSLLWGAARVLTRLEILGRRHDRPVILTEAGFASSPAPWREPWTEERGRGARVELEDQARAYRAMMRALEGREGIAGVYWWKWPTVGPEDPERHPGFTPAGKPAQEEISRWFNRR